MIEYLDKLRTLPSNTKLNVFVDDGGELFVTEAPYIKLAQRKPVEVSLPKAEPTPNMSIKEVKPIGEIKFNRNDCTVTVKAFVDTPYDKTMFPKRYTAMAKVDFFIFRERPKEIFSELYKRGHQEYEEQRKIGLSTFRWN